MARNARLRLQAFWLVPCTALGLHASDQSLFLLASRGKHLRACAAAVGVNIGWKEPRRAYREPLRAVIQQL